ncbi:MAG: hypothetical protein IPM13_18585, partial [Phycisphaerales bacterium]|nr:hypothetical protein [Phycisphaerales bacterium]
MSKTIASLGRQPTKPPEHALRLAPWRLGWVFLPAGTFRVSFGTNTSVPAALWVHGDGVVLRGAGRQSTRLFLDETVTRQRQIVLFRPQAGGHWYQAVGSAIALARDL